MTNRTQKLQKTFMKVGLIASLLCFMTAQAAAFTETDGDKLYHELCASCHMPDGKGAVGAGMYPSFVDNAKIGNKAYPQVVVLYGLNAMPALGGVLNDEQIANVINYTRSHFGGYHDDEVTEEEISLLRIPDYEYNDLN